MHSSASCAHKSQVKKCKTARRGLETAACARLVVRWGVLGRRRRRGRLRPVDERRGRRIGWRRRRRRDQLVAMPEGAVDVDEPRAPFQGPLNDATAERALVAPGRVCAVSHTPQLPEDEKMGGFNAHASLPIAVIPPAHNGAYASALRTTGKGFTVVDGVPHTEERGITWYKRNSTWRVRVRGVLVGNFFSFEEAVSKRDIAEPSYAAFRTMTTEEKAARGKEKSYEYFTKTKHDPVRKQARKDACFKYKHSEHGIGKIQARQQLPHVRAAHAAVTGRLINRIGQKIMKMFKDGKLVSQTVSEYTPFTSNEDAKAHFDSQFEDWMSWDNHGLHNAGAPYKAAWQVGHKIPRAKYDHSNPEDIKRCWSAVNLFPQDAKENIENRDKMPPPEVLLPLREIWPASWKGVLP